MNAGEIKFEKLTKEYSDAEQSINEKIRRIEIYTDKAKEILSELEMLKKGLEDAKQYNLNRYEEYKNRDLNDNYTFFYFDDKPYNRRSIGHLKRLIQCFEEYSRRFRNNNF